MTTLTAVIQFGDFNQRLKNLMFIDIHFLKNGIFRLRDQFKKLLSETSQVTPGATLEDTYLSFVGKDCYIGLSQSERDDVFDDYQEELKNQVKHEFHDLLWERTETFIRQRMQPNSSDKITQEDLNLIKEEIEKDPR